MDELAIFGGKQCVSISKPHWAWPPVCEEEIDAVVAEMRTGKRNKKGYPEIVEEFENNFAKYHNIEFALTANSGTSSIHSAFFALGVGPGDEVIAPTFTFPATATPLLHVNATPVLCDCLPDTGTISPKDIEKKITGKTKAIIITHLWGHPCEMDEILELVKKHNLFLIEDCSHAHGATYRGKKVGTFGDIGCFSLDSQKMMAAGEAGILITNNRKFYERALLYSDFGPRIKNELTIPAFKKFSSTGYGLKYRAHPLAAAIANVKLQRLEKLNCSRNEILNKLSCDLKNIRGVSPPITKDYVDRGAFWGYKPFYMSEELCGIPLDTFIKVLQAEGMDIRMTGTPPLHLHNLFASPDDGMFTHGCPRRCPLVKQTYSYKKGDLPLSEAFYKRIFSLPTFTFDESKRLVEQYVNAFEKVTDYFAKNSANVLKKLARGAPKGGEL